MDFDWDFRAWGDSGTPWLPTSLREAWAEDRLPVWAVHLGGLHKDARVGDLRFIPEADANSRERLTNLAALLLKHRVADAGLIQALSGNIPSALDLANLPYSTRTRNCLAAEGLLSDRSQAASVTFSQLLRIPRMGIRSALDFACTTEGAMRQYELLRNEAAESANQEHCQLQQMIEDLADVAGEPWADQISELDPRFKQILPSGRGSVLERVEKVISDTGMAEIRELYGATLEVREKVAAISSLPLDRALEELLDRSYKLSEVRRAGFLDRLGWRGKPPQTLQAVGSQFGITRERVRQIEAKILDRLPPKPIFMPPLERAIALLEASGPVSPEEAAKALEQHGIASIPFSPQSVLSAAEICGHATSLRIRTIKGTRVLLGRWKEGLAKKLALSAFRQCGASGVSNVAAVVEHAVSEGLKVTEEEAEGLLKLIPALQFLTDTWFWHPGAPLGRNRLRNVCRKMLSVASPISIQKLREGTRREYAFRMASHHSRWQLRVPPADVFRRFLEVHPEFCMDASGNARSTTPLDYTVELGEVYKTVVEVLRASPSGVLDRQSIRDACLGHGINASSLEVALTYSSVVEHLDTNIWGIRGIHVEPSAIEALRSANAMKPREKRIHGFGWTPEGKIWVAVRLPGNFTNPVVGIPGGVKRFISGKRFQAKTQDGSEQGTIGVTDDGSAYGFGGFLVRAGADEGDVMAIEFDLAEGVALLNLGGEELIDALES